MTSIIMTPARALTPAIGTVLTPSVAVMLLPSISLTVSSSTPRLRPLGRKPWPHKEDHFNTTTNPTISKHYMKKLAVTLCLSAIAVGAFAQGTVNFLNGATSLTRTNGAALGFGTGNTAPGASGYYYAVFTASSSITSATALDLLS